MKPPAVRRPVPQTDCLRPLDRFPTPLLARPTGLTEARARSRCGTGPRTSAPSIRVLCPGLEILAEDFARPVADRLTPGGLALGVRVFDLVGYGSFRTEGVQMTSLPDRSNIAVVVVDVQNGVVAGAFRRDAVIANINDLVTRARSADVAVVWVQHQSQELPAGSEQWQYVPELQMGVGEPVIHKCYGDSFEDTTLEQELASRGVGRLIVAGALTDACVRSTLHGAFTRGYDVTLVGDAHTTEDLTEWGAPPVELVIAHTNLYWSWQTAPGRTAAVVPAASVDFNPPSG